MSEPDRSPPRSPTGLARWLRRLVTPVDIDSGSAANTPDRAPPEAEQSSWSLTLVFGFLALAFPVQAFSLFVVSLIILLPIGFYFGFGAIAIQSWQWRATRLQERTQKRRASAVSAAVVSSGLVLGLPIFILGFNRVLALLTPLFLHLGWVAAGGLIVMALLTIRGALRRRPHPYWRWDLGEGLLWFLGGLVMLRLPPAGELSQIWFGRLLGLNLCAEAARQWLRQREPSARPPGPPV